MISVIVATFQRAHYLGESLESIFGQSYSDIEVIVVDDGSTDNTRAVAASFAGCRYFFQENHGVSHARNKGVALARGEYLAFLDSDDFWPSCKLQRQMTCMKENPDIELLFGNAVQFVSKEVGKNEKKRLQCPTEPVPAQVSSTLLASKAVFTRVGGFDESLMVSVDVDWYLRALALNLKIVTLPDVLLHRRIHPGNSGFLHGDKKQQHVGVVKAHLDRMRQKRSLQTGMQ